MTPQDQAYESWRKEDDRHALMQKLRGDGADVRFDVMKCRYLFNEKAARRSSSQLDTHSTMDAYKFWELNESYLLGYFKNKRRFCLWVQIWDVQLVLGDIIAKRLEWQAKFAKGKG